MIPKKERYYQRPRQWFVDRIGKRVYRKPLTCKCNSCQKCYVDIWDGKQNGEQNCSREQHADYLFLCHNEMGIKYFDTMEEAKNAI